MNDAPVLDPVGNKGVDELIELAFTVTASDVENDTLTFSLEGEPTGATINPTSGAFSWTPTEAQGPGVYPFTVKVCDDGSPSLCDEEAITVTVNEVNVAPVLGAIGDRTVDEGSELNFTGTATDADFPANTLIFSLIDAPAGATINGSTGAFAWTPPDNGTFTFTVHVCDDGDPILCDEEEITVTVLNVAPIVTLTGPEPGTPFQIGTPVTFTATCEDPGADDWTATWEFTSADGTTTVGPTDLDGCGDFEQVHTFTEPGIYYVTVTVDDGDDSHSDSTIGDLDAFIVVFDPEGGFVTGGGWINSPAGAYRDDLGLVGKATFGFNAKYKKGSHVPQGQTEFQFKAGNLNFHSTSYYEGNLVIAGARATFKGTGTINGQGNYEFTLTVIDGQVNGGGGVDKFRIKIKDAGPGGAVVYDNDTSDGGDNAEPPTALGGGSIVIHSGGPGGKK